MPKVNKSWLYSIFFNCVGFVITKLMLSTVDFLKESRSVLVVREEGIGDGYGLSSLAESATLFALVRFVTAIGYSLGIKQINCSYWFAVL